jgi:hypothetical protein
MLVLSKSSLNAVRLVLSNRDLKVVVLTWRCCSCCCKRVLNDALAVELALKAAFVIANFSLTAEIP